MCGGASIFRPMVSGRVLCISAGMLAPKKADNPVGRSHLYLNFGLLGLASVLASDGFDPVVVHGGFVTPEDFIRDLVERVTLSEEPLILLSIPSSFSLPWARRGVEALRRLVPAARIVVGGRWVVADDEPWIRSRLPDVDVFARGVAEGYIVDIARGDSLGRRARRRVPSIPELDYRLLEGMECFNPSLEVSRGCGMGCAFCAEAREPLGGMKPPRRLVAEMARLIEVYGTASIRPYLEASLFRPTSAWVGELGEALEASGVHLPWRTETRVDTMPPDLIPGLARAGLRILDLGLESGSPAQLRRMRKTTRPDVYLRRASSLLEACRREGVWVKVNILVHPGETLDTVAQTRAWLEEHRSAIKGVSVGPTILFRYGRASAALLAEFELHGASVVDRFALDRDGFAHLHPSRSISHDAAVELSNEISRSMMSARDYYDLKSFGYLPRQSSWDDFRQIVVGCPGGNFSFRLEGLG